MLYSQLKYRKPRQQLPPYLKKISVNLQDLKLNFDNIFRMMEFPYFSHPVCIRTTTVVE